MEFALLSIRRNPFATADPYRTLMIVSQNGRSSADAEQMIFEYLVGLENSRQTIQYYSRVCAQAQHALKPLRLFYFSQYLVFHDTNKARKLLEQALALLREPYQPWASHIFSQYGHLIHSVPAYRSHRNARDPLEKALQISPEDHLCQSVYASYLLSVGELERGLEFARKATGSDELWSRVSAYFMIACHTNAEAAARAQLLTAIREALESQLAIPMLFLDDHAKHNVQMTALLDALKTRKRETVLQCLEHLK